LLDAENGEAVRFGFLIGAGEGEQATKSQ
jgi:hypothetical protein